MNWLFIAVFIALTYLVSIQFYYSRFKKVFENIIISLSVSVLVIGVLALGLVVLNQYSLFNLILFIVILSVGLLIVQFKKRYSFLVFTVNKKCFNLQNVILISLLIVVCYLYFFFPTQYILGGRDPGVYVVTAVNIAKTGGLNFDDPLLNEMYQYLGDDLRLGYPGIYSELARGFSNSASDLVPQFYHLLPTYQAISYDLFGIDGLLRTTGFFGLFSIMLMYLMTKKISGGTAALIVMVLMLVNPAQLWNVRMPVTETLGQFILILSMYLLSKYWSQKSLIPFMLIGIVLGLSCLNRIDSFIYLIGILLGIIVISLFKSDYIKRSIVFLLGFCTVGVLGILYGLYYTKPYIIDLWRLGALKLLLYGNMLLILMLAMILILRRYHFIEKAFIKLQNWIMNNKNVLVVLLSVAFCCFFIYCLILRPYLLSISDAEDQYTYLFKHSLDIFSWYVPITLIFFSFFGLKKMLFSNKIFQFLIFTLVGTIMFLAYIYNPSITEDHFWASRRWQLFSIPFIIIMAIVGLFSMRFKERVTRVALIFIVVSASVIYSMQQSRLFALNTMLGNYLVDYEEINLSLPEDDALYFTREGQIASPLMYVYNKDTYLLSKNDSTFYEKLTPLIRQGKRIFTINLGIDKVIESNKSFSYFGNYKITGQFPEHSITHLPSKLYDRTYGIEIYEITERNDGYAYYEWAPSGKSFHTKVGEKIDDKIVSGGANGVLVYGPYIALPKGNYKLIIEGKSSESIKSNQIIFDVSSDKGRNIIVDKKYFNAKDDFVMGEATFELNEKKSDIEFRVFLNEAIQVEIVSIKLIRKL